MRLVSKLTLVLMLAVAVVLTVQAVFDVSRVLELHERETRDDLSLLGSAMAAAVGEIWQLAGEREARAYVRRADTRRARTRIRIVPLGSAPTPETKILEDQMVATVPLRVPGGLALHLTRGRTDRSGFVRHVVWTQVVTTGALVVVFAVLSLLLGVRLVGQRVERLADQARRVAAGELATTRDSRHDELGFLAKEMNQMAAHLDGAKQQIREERRARTELLEQLRHSDRLSTIGRIASSIAHELGTPLNVVSGRAMMIAEDQELDSEARENAAIISQQAQLMTDNIRRLLDYSRGRGLQRERADVVGIVDQALRLMEPLADDQGVRLRRAGAPEVEAELDGGKLLQVLTNLIMNGIQAMPEGGELTVGVETAQVDHPDDIHAAAGQYVRIDVRDEGTGIARQDLAQIFEPFFTTKSSGQGTGLGLSVCHGIVREHGGWLSVESAPGEGSCFSVHLPRGGVQ